MVLALNCRVCITPNLCIRGWFESNAKYWSVCVALRQTLVVSLLSLMVVRQSRPGKAGSCLYIVLGWILYLGLCCYVRKMKFDHLYSGGEGGHVGEDPPASIEQERVPAHHSTSPVGLEHHFTVFSVFNTQHWPCHSPDEVHRLWMKRCDVKVSPVKHL